MKTFVALLAGFGLGYGLNTKTGKNFVTWGVSKIQNQVNSLVGKINEVTSSDSPSTPTTPTPEGK